MVQPTAAYLTQSGVSYSDPESYHNLLVAAYTTSGDGGIRDVVLTITDEDGTTYDLVSTARALWQPTDSAEQDQVPGSWGTGASYIWCYGFHVKLRDYKAGRLLMRATVTPASGVATTLSQQVIFNNTDGVDRRGSRLELFVSPTGDDSNTGTRVGPLRTIQAAVYAARNTTTSSVGGAFVYLMSGHHAWGSSTSTVKTVNTVDGYWLTIAADPYATYGSVVVDAGATTLEANGLSTFNVRLKNLRIENGSLGIRTTGHIVNTWLDHCEIAPLPDYEDNVYLRAYDTKPTKQYVYNVGGQSGTHAVTGTHLHHVYQGFYGYSLVRGCQLTNIQGEAFRQCPTVVNCYLDTHKIDGLGYLPVTVTTLSISAPSDGVMRVRSSESVNLASVGAALANSSSVYIKVAALGSRNTGVFRCLGGGSDESGDYIDLANTCTPVTSSGTIYTSTAQGTLWDSLDESYVYRYDTSAINVVACNVHARKVSKTVRGLYVTGAISRMALDNVGISTLAGTGTKGLSGVTHSSITNLLVRSCTFAGTGWQWSTKVHTNVEVMNNLFDSVTYVGTTSQEVSDTTTSSHNHFTNKSESFGVQSTSGLPWSGNTETGDLRVASSSTAYNTASRSYDLPTVWTATSKGVWSSIAVGDWSTPTGSVQHDYLLVREGSTSENQNYFSLRYPVNATSSGQESIPTYAKMQSVGRGYAWKTNTGVSEWDEQQEWVAHTRSAQVVNQSRHSTSIYYWRTIMPFDNIDCQWLRRSNHARGIAVFETFDFNSNLPGTRRIYEPTLGGSETHQSIPLHRDVEHVIPSTTFAGLGSVTALSGTTIPAERVSYGPTSDYTHGGDANTPAIDYRMRQTYTLGINAGGEGAHELNLWSYHPTGIEYSDSSNLKLGCKLHLLDAFTHAYAFDPATGDEVNVTALGLDGLNSDLTYTASSGLLEAYSPTRYSLDLLRAFSTSSASIILESTILNGMCVGIVGRLEASSSNQTQLTTIGLLQRRQAGVTAGYDVDSGPSLYIGAEGKSRQAGWTGVRVWIVTGTASTIRSRIRELSGSFLSLEHSADSPYTKHPMRRLY